MLTDFLSKHHIILKKGANAHILFLLALNELLRTKLWLHKKFHGIRRPIVHYYAVCWNEERMLPFMFDHYGSFVDRFTLCDNHSTDRSAAIIRSRNDATLLEFDSDGFSDSTNVRIKNSCWKRSRGHADYVIVCDIDEFLYHPDISQLLSQLKEKHLSVVKPTGYDMYSAASPTPLPGQPLTSQVDRGLRAPLYDKCILFDPHSVVEINYMPGSHECHPWGRIKTYAGDDVRLLHYKNLGIDWLLERNRQYVERLSKDNLANDYGVQYLRSEEAIIADFQRNLQQSIPVSQ